MSKEKIGILRIIDILSGSMYDIGKGLVPAIVMNLLFKTQPLGISVYQSIICIIMAFSGIVVEYFKLNKYLNIIFQKKSKEIEELLK